MKVNFLFKDVTFKIDCYLDESYFNIHEVEVHDESNEVEIQDKFEKAKLLMQKFHQQIWQDEKDRHLSAVLFDGTYTAEYDYSIDMNENEYFNTNL